MRRVIAANSRASEPVNQGATATDRLTETTLRRGRVDQGAVAGAQISKAEFVWQVTASLMIVSLAVATVCEGFDSLHEIKSFPEFLLWAAWLVVQFSSLTAAAIATLDDLLSANGAQDAAVLAASPKVSIHVPIHREPVNVVSATLQKLATIDYGAFEVIVVDNNTPEQQLWRPIEALSEQLGFRFFHLEQWPGYKAGALNFAAKMTSTDADYIAVLDADYLVKPDFLTKLTARFSNNTIAFVQAPQDYRYDHTSVYQSSCYFAYRYFFDISMAARQRMDSIIFVGTMGIIKKSVLVESGGWDEGCLTEDAEMGLRVAARGYVGTFVNTSLGQGIMPLDYLSLRRQRYRWAFGGAQILRKYWPLLGTEKTSKATGLTAVQRYGFSCFFLNWFEAWLVVGTTFLFWMLALLCVWSQNIERFAVPAAYAELLILTFVVRYILFVGSTMRRSRCTFPEACGAYFVLSSLNWIVSCACLSAMLSRPAQFERTPKDRPGRETFPCKLRHVQIELALAITSFAIGGMSLLLGEAGVVARMYAAGCLLGGLLFLSSIIVLVVDHLENAGEART